MKKILLTWGALAPALLFCQHTYRWNNSSPLWYHPSAWTPERTLPLPDDILEFEADATVAALPDADKIGALRIHNSATVYLSSLQPGNIIVGEGGINGPHFVVDAGAALHVTGSQPVSFHIAANATGQIGGAISFAGSEHRLTAASPGALVFHAGAGFTADAGFSGNAFGTMHLHSVVFEQGATYVSMSTTGSTPFGAPAPDAVVIFENGSNYIHRTNTPVPALAGRTYGNLIIEGNLNFAGIGSARNCTIQNNLHLKSGFLSFKPNTIATHTGNFLVKGDIICESEAWIDIGNENMTGAVELAGTDQSVGVGSGTGSLTFFNFTCNNLTTTLHRPLNISGNLHLQNGKIFSTDTAPLILHAHAGITSCMHDYSNLPYTHIGCDHSFVEGLVTKKGLNNESFAFPLGAGNKLRPLLLHEATGEFTVRYIRSDPYNDVGDIMGNGIHHVSHLEYWQIAGAGSVKVELPYFDPNSGGVTDMEALRVARYDGAAWQAQGVAGFVGSPGANGSVTSTTTTGSGFFSLGSSSDYPNNPLPLDDYVFGVYAEDDKVAISWQVDTSVYKAVIVEKLIMDSFRAISSHLSGETLAYDENPQENNIYRLKIFNTTGLVYVTDSKLVRVQRGEQMRVYPNPAREKIFIKIPSASSIFELYVVNITGLIVKRIYPRNQTILEIEIRDLPPGIYYVIPGQTHFPIGRFIKLNE